MHNLNMTEMSYEELKQKILKDIKKSGFLSEMKTNEILINNEWTNTSNAETYFDKDLNKSREIDITAYKVKYVKERDIRLGLHLIIEVKKSEKPWVIFCHDKSAKVHFGLGWGILNFSDNVTRHQLSYDEINSKNRHFNSKYYGTSYHEAFKEPSENSQIYSALISCCKAAVHQRELNSWDIEDKNGKENSKNYDLQFFMPIVVFDGLLFQATLDSKGELDLAKIDYSPIR